AKAGQSSHSDSAEMQLEAPAKIADEIDEAAVSLHFEKINGNGLFAKGNKEVAKDFLIQENAELILGRNPNCDIGLQSGRVSRLHCKLSLHNGNLFIQDLGSANRTQVNGKLIDPGKEVQLRNQDIIRIADEEYRLSL
ncbi:MAG: FHA domain-containing protein, partial [Cyanobacteria bacterium]|nr:FHA domain-containing protein [Cyanobacteriota bacterium]